MNPLLSSVIHSVAHDNLGKNWVFSPASYLEAMLGLKECVVGQNLTEVQVVLAENETSLSSFKEALKSLDETYNCFLYADEYRNALNPDIIASLAQIGFDLKEFTTPDSAVAEVNRLVEKKTRGRIQGLATRDNITELTKLIILNCVYFKRDWAHPLKQSCGEYTFVNANATTTSLRPLRHNTYYHYYEDPLFDLVELPYKDSSLCCYLFVPTALGSVFKILDAFSTHFAQIKRVARNREVRLTVPPFKVETTTTLVGPTQTAGVRSVFRWNKDWKVVDFDRLDSQAVLCVQDIVQKTFLDFNEKGAEAAAATMMAIGLTGCCMPVTRPEPKIITANQPFVFCIADKNNPDHPLFVGAVNQL